MSTITSIRIDKEMLDEVDAAAAHLRRSRNSIIEEAIEDYLRSIERIRKRAANK